jgi:uncharacterized membrane protein
MNSACHRLPDAALAGLASSMRTTSGPFVLAARGRISGRARYAVAAAFVGELIADKTPAIPARTDPPALAGRIASGAYTGHAVAGAVGLAAGGIAAALGTYTTFRIRRLAVERTGLPDPVVAIGEDVLAVMLAAFATRRPDFTAVGCDDDPA